MRARHVIVMVAVVGGTLAVAIWWPGTTSNETGSAPAAESNEAPPSVRATATQDPRPQEAPRGAGARADRVATRRDAGPDLDAGEATSRGRTVPVTWPVVPGRRGPSTARPANGQTAVPAELAFQALALVGVDAEAEKTWRRAIDDPNTPAGLRSDLIEDLNQEGYTDNSHPTKADLPLILARLELIERLAPYAMDEVNAAAFEEAYKDLLNMYLRLGGEPR